MERLKGTKILEQASATTEAFRAKEAEKVNKRIETTATKYMRTLEPRIKEASSEGKNSIIFMGLYGGTAEIKYPNDFDFHILQSGMENPTSIFCAVLARCRKEGFSPRLILRHEENGYTFKIITIKW